MNIYLLSLGCPRNLVDSEVLKGALRDKGMSIIEDALEADVLIVNTCAFVESAKKEAIASIFSLAQIKASKPKETAPKLIVSGCLAQRYADDITKQIPEIDAIFGTSDFLKIPKKIIYWNKRSNRIITKKPAYLYDHTKAREILTPSHYAYLKIQEGCKNFCSYCVIPKIRGKYRSRTIASIVKETQILKQKNVKELILVGQDTTLFGVDRYGKSKLSTVLKKTASIMKNRWVRLFYTHPANLKDEDIKVIADEPSICNYVDLPIQHINDKILKQMNRRVTKKQIIKLIEKIRKTIPGVVLRTSIIAGFPGETKKDFAELMQFLKDIKFERLGVFSYSREEGTPAYSFKGQLCEEEKNSRVSQILTQQQQISLKNNENYIGKKLQVLIDEQDQKDKNLFLGRTYMDGPDIDGICYVHSNKKLLRGSFHDVMITDALEYDLIGECK